MGSHEPVAQRRTGIQWGTPPSPYLSALSLVKDQTRKALVRAREEKSPDADTLDEEYQILCRRFAKELVTIKRESVASTLERIAL